jgi:hypothetical protein
MSAPSSDDTVISVDLAFRSAGDCGVVALRRVAERIKAHPIRLPDRGSRGRLAPESLAGFLSAVGRESNARLVLLDGPQAWKAADNGLDHARHCERELATPGKTGLPGQTKPRTFLSFARHSVQVFDALETRGWPRLGPDLACGTGCAVESFPTSAWRTLGLAPLRSKRRATRDEMDARLGELGSLFALELGDELTHDELQALVAGLAGFPLLASAEHGYRLSGTPPIFVDGAWREGYIVNPTRRALLREHTRADAHADPRST